MLRTFRLFVCFCLCVGAYSRVCIAQAPSDVPRPTAAKELSHTERFASPREKLEREVRTATSKLARNPRDAKALDDRGMARVRLGDLSNGMHDIKRATELNPKSADFQTDLAYALWTGGQLKEALVAARRAIALQPVNPAAHYYLARLIIESGGKLDEAVENFKLAVDENPLEMGFRFDLFNAYLQQGNVTLAASQLRLMRMNLPPDNAQLLYAEGLYEVSVQNLTGAIANFRKALQSNARLHPVRLDLGVALCKNGEWRAAAEVLAALSADLPESYQAAYFHALALKNLNRIAEAKQETRRALALNPQSAEAYTLLGIALSEDRDFEGAIKDLLTATQINPENYDAQFYLGRAEYALRNLARARDAFAAAARLRPDDVESHFFLGTTLEGLGDIEAAIAEYRTLTKKYPKDARGYLGLGNLLAKGGQLETATEALQRARELDPNNFEAALDLGRVLLRQGKLDEAIGVLSKAVALAEENADVHYQLGLALQRAGRDKEATEQFTIVDRLNKQYRSGPTGMGEPPRER